VTTAIHNSRYSQRMFDNHVKLDEPIWLSEKDELVITRSIAEIIKEDKLNMLEYNICGDHMHILLVCGKEELPTIAGKLKAVSGRKCNIARGITIPARTPPDTSAISPTTRGHAPLSYSESDIESDIAMGNSTSTDKEKKKYNSLWTQKFGRREITNKNDLKNVIEYIKNNRKKHKLPENREIRSLAKEMCCSHKHAFRTEYKGGFDVVIGNPPYVKVQNLNHTEIDWFKKNKKVAHKRVDISIMFFELGSEIVKQGGKLSFITSNQFLNAEYGRKCRELFLTKFNIEEIIDFGDLPIFEDALTYVSIFTLKQDVPGDFTYCKVDSISEALSTHWEKKIRIKHSSLSDNSWVLKDEKVDELIKKMEALPPLSKFGNCNYGIVSGNDSVFIVGKDQIESCNLERDSLLPLIRANNCGRYEFVDYDLYIIYPFKYENEKTTLLSETEFKEKFPNTYSYLQLHKESLSKRKDSRKTFENRDDWYTLTRFGRIDMFNESKIVYPGETKANKFGIDRNKAGYSGARVFSITLNNTAKEQFSIYDLLGVLNSKLIEFYLHAFSPVKAGGYYSYSSTILNKIPVNIVGAQLSVKVERIIELHETRKKIVQKYLRFIGSKYHSLAITRNLASWYEDEFGDFIKELNKAIKKVGGEKLTKMDEMEWMEVFETKKAEVQSLRAEIDKVDSEIDRMVYELYGLTEEEIKIVEGNQ